MSFILDALKKSESDRQRQSGPALFEVKVAPPRRRFPYWALALAALLAVNLIVLAWMFLRPAPALPAIAPSRPALAGNAAPTPRVIATVPAPAPITAPTPAVTTSTMPPAAKSEAAAEPVLSDAETKSAPLNPDDYAPAVEPSTPGGYSQPHVQSGTESGVPLYSDAAATPGSHLPALRLDLHVYAARPQDRFVLINMHRLHEGDTLPEGVHVDSITAEGAVVSYHGAKFLLEHE